MKEMIRLDKLLCEMGKGSRSQIKEAARKGRIQVNGLTEKKSDRKINPLSDQVYFDGQMITYVSFEYFMMNKPAGVVSATRDNLHTTVIDLIKDHNRDDIFPVGRLDIDTEGLLLITNDGALSHQLLSPSNHVDKTYYAKIKGALNQSAIARFAEGIVLKDGTVTMPSHLELLSSGNGFCEIRLTIQEGKFHQVKRMMEALDCQVEYLKRESMGSLKLDIRLEPGEYRKLTKEELKQLKDR